MTMLARKVKVPNTLFFPTVVPIITIIPSVEGLRGRIYLPSRSRKYWLALRVTFSLGRS